MEFILGDGCTRGVFLDLILNANCMLNGWSNIPSLQDILGDEAVGART
jgi:hypothetical protein